MPISEKIQKEINALDVSPDEKKLVLDLLEIEDGSTYRYKTDYVDLIKKYIREHGEDDGVNE